MKKVKSGSDISFNFNVKVTDKTTVDEIIREASDIIKVRFAEYKVEPEESEDERIRKLLVSLVTIAPTFSALAFTMKDSTDCLSYLEKQKEQKPSFGIYWHKIKKGERLPCRAYVWNPDYEKHHDCFEGRLIANLENILVGGDTWYLPADDVRNLPREGVDELPREQKPAGKQDYSGLTDLERAIHRGFLSAGVENVPVTIIKETANECKRTQTIANENANAEWSEEDEDIRDTIIHDLKRLGGDIANVKPAYKKEIDWLKSIRPKHPWKPSEEQIESVRYFVNKHQSEAWAATGQWKQFTALRGLLGDLLKLM